MAGPNSGAVPWGGGTVRGPSGGVDYDSGKVGYDCSGFTMFSYAAAGVKLPKYSGDQYNAGQRSRSRRQNVVTFCSTVPAVLSTW